MPTRSYAARELIFQEGTTAEEAFIVQSGSVQLVRMNGANEAVLATVGAGKCFGELAVLEMGTQYPYSARAAHDTVVQTFTRDEFLALLAQCPPTLQPLLECAFDQYRRTALRGQTTQEAGATLEGVQRITLQAGTDSLRTQIPEPLNVALNRLPYKIGGYPENGEINSMEGNNLYLASKAPPLMVSRQHCQIEIADGKLILLDLGSRFCTIVNDLAIGRGHGRYQAPLSMGENLVRLGGYDSPYLLKIVVE